MACIKSNLYRNRYFVFRVAVLPACLSVFLFWSSIILVFVCDFFSCTPTCIFSAQQFLKLTSFQAVW